MDDEDITPLEPLKRLMQELSESPVATPRNANNNNNNHNHSPSPSDSSKGPSVLGYEQEPITEKNQFRLKESTAEPTHEYAPRELLTETSGPISLGAEFEKLSLEQQVKYLANELVQTKQQMRDMEERHKGQINRLFQALESYTQFHDTNDMKVRFTTGQYTSAIFKGHTKSVSAVRLRNEILVSSSADKTINIWDITNQTVIKTLRGHTSGICTIEYGDQTTILSGAWDKSIRLWDIRTGESKVLEIHTNGVRAVKVFKKILLSGGADRLIFVWSLRTGEPSMILQGHEAGVWAIECNDNFIVSAGADASIRIWDFQTGKNLKVLKGHKKTVTTLELHKNILASGSLDKTIRFWDLDSGSMLRTIEHPTEVYKISIWQNALLFSGSSDEFLRIWDMTSGKLLRKVRTEGEGVFDLQLEKNRVAVASGNLITCFEF